MRGVFTPPTQFSLNLANQRTVQKLYRHTVFASWIGSSLTITARSKCFSYIRLSL